MKTYFKLTLYTIFIPTISIHILFHTLLTKLFYILLTDIWRLTFMSFGRNIQYTREHINLLHQKKLDGTTVCLEFKSEVFSI